MLRVSLRGFQTAATFLAGLAISLMIACTSGDDGVASPTVVVATPIPTIVSTPFRLPTATQTPITNLGRAGAEIAIWEHISECANQVVVESGSAATLSFDSVYRLEDSSWTIEASSPGLGLNLGRWRVNDLTKQVTPLDVVSEALFSTETICKAPTARFANGLTPPLFTGPDGAGNSSSGQVTQEQARLKVWVAIRNCYVNLLQLEEFTVYPESAERWLVVGTGGNGENYGMWFVGAGSGSITPHDSTAIITSRNTGCYFEP